MKLIYRIIYPNKCIGCNKVLAINGESVCDECIEEIADNFILNPSDKTIPYILYFRNAFYHEGITRKILIDFKYRHKRRNGVWIAENIMPLFESINKNIEIDFITFVPNGFMHRYIRGYNPSAEIAKMIASTNGVPCGRTLRKKLFAKKQVGLSVKDRIENAEKIFSICNNVDVKGKTVLIIDDVMTTGSSVSECAKILTYNGASKVCAITVTKANGL